MVMITESLSPPPYSHSSRVIHVLEKRKCKLRRERCNDFNDLGCYLFVVIYSFSQYLQDVILPTTMSSSTFPSNCGKNAMELNCNKAVSFVREVKVER